MGALLGIAEAALKMYMERFPDRNVLDSWKFEYLKDVLHFSESFYSPRRDRALEGISEYLLRKKQYFTFSRAYLINGIETCYTGSVSEPFPYAAQYINDI